MFKKKSEINPLVKDISDFVEIYKQYNICTYNIDKSSRENSRQVSHALREFIDTWVEDINLCAENHGKKFTNMVSEENPEIFHERNLHFIEQKIKFINNNIDSINKKSLSSDWLKSFNSLINNFKDYCSNTSDKIESFIKNKNENLKTLFIITEF